MGRKKKKTEMVPYKDPKVYVKSKIPFHINYTMRLSFVLFSFIFITLVLGIFVNQTNNLYKESRFKFAENGYITYDVELKENNFYNDNVLGMDKAYVPELIDKFNIYFNYNINSDEYLELDYENIIKYDFIVINNVDSKVLYETANYDIRRHNLDKEKSLKYSDQIEFDYGFYKNKYDELVSVYGKDITGYINVSNTIHKKSDLDLLDGYLKEDKVYSIKLPITDAVFSINMSEDSKMRNETLVIKKDKVTSANRLLIFTIIVLCVLYVVVFIIFIKLISLLRTKQSKYDKFVNGILKEYDSVIVETLLYPNTEGLNKISVKNFKEILDTHDLLHKPILYFNVVSHMKCIFYILDDKNLYVYTVKEVDLED